MANTPKVKKQRKIMTKLLFLIVPAVVVTIIALVESSSIITRKTMRKTAISQLDSSISNQAGNIEAWLEENLESFSSIKKIIEKTSPDDATLNTILNSFYGSNKYCADGPYVATASGKTYKAGESSKSFGDITNETRYHKFVKIHIYCTISNKRLRIGRGMYEYRKEDRCSYQRINSCICGYGIVAGIACFCSF